MLQAGEITVARGRRDIVRDLSIELSPGEVVAVLGPNGAGKSTVLAALSGALALRLGEVTLDGRPLRNLPPRFLARRRAVLPQASELAFGFHAIDVVLLGRAAHAGRGSAACDLSIAMAALVEAEALHLAERIYTTLSGGERQRVQLARTLAQIDAMSADPEGASRYLLLDEPTSSLDLAHQHGTLAAARRAAARGIGVLTVLHDLNLAAMYADRILVIAGGRLLAAGQPAEVLTEDVVARAFALAVRVQPHPTRDCPQVVAL